MRRLAILDAALAQFAKEGYRGTTIAAVAQAAGITDAGLLYHFASKEDLLVEVLAHHDQIEADRIQELSKMDRLAAIRHLGTWGEMMEHDPTFMALHVVLTAEHLHDNSATHAYFQLRYEWLLAVVSAMFLSARDAGEIRSDVDPQHEASAFIGFVDGLRLQWFFADRRPSMPVREYVDTLIRRIQA